MIKITGLDKLQRRLDDLQRRAKDLDGTHDLTFAELFPDSFMHRNTRFPSMQAMIDEAGIEDGDDIQKPEWSSFVAHHTKFSSWHEMKSAAGQEWAKKRLGF